jgi:hypothetical protein
MAKLMNRLPAALIAIAALASGAWAHARIDVAEGGVGSSHGRLLAAFFACDTFFEVGPRPYLFPLTRNERYEAARASPSSALGTPPLHELDRWTRMASTSDDETVEHRAPPAARGRTVESRSCGIYVRIGGWRVGRAQ